MSILKDQLIYLCQTASAPCPKPINGVCANNKLCGLQCGCYNNCVDCLGKIFYDPIHRHRKYECLPITYTYVERFTDTFASEVYRILDNHDYIFNDIEEKNILSLGCGPATELIAIEKIMRDKSINAPCHYAGFDKNDIWSSVWNFIIQIFQSNHISVAFQNVLLLPDNSLLQNTKLLILNHVVSDVYKHSKYPSADTYNFLQTDITQIIHQMPSDSFILISDANSNRMGRDEIERWVNNSSITQIIDIGCFENFKYPDRAKFYSAAAKVRQDRSSVFTNNQVCQSAYVLLKKM